MNLHEVTNVPAGRKHKFRVGRGRGSGVGKTSRRGQKGASSRAGWGGGIMREGGQMPIVRRVPKKGFNNANFRVTYEVVNVQRLADLAPENHITPEVLKKVGLVKKSARWVKILGKGDLKVPLKVTAHQVSVGARAKIEAAGGSVEILPGPGGVVAGVPVNRRQSAAERKAVKKARKAKSPKKAPKEAADKGKE